MACALVLQHATQGTNHLVLPASGFTHGAAIEAADQFAEAILITRGAAGAEAQGFTRCLAGQLPILRQRHRQPRLMSLTILAKRQWKSLHLEQWTSLRSHASTVG